MFPFSHSFPTEARGFFLFCFVLFPNFQGKILTNGSPDSYQQKFGLFQFKVEPFLSEDENISLTAHRGKDRAFALPKRRPSGAGC